MDKFLFTSESPEDRRELLQNSSDGFVVEKFYRALSAEELKDKKSEMADNVIELDAIEAEKKDAVAAFKIQTDPLKMKHKTLSSEIRTGFEEVEGTLYKIIDIEKGWVYFYTAYGELIENKSRPALGDERQKTIQMALREGTNN